MGGQAGPDPGVQGGVEGVWDVARSRVTASRRGAGSACVIRWPPRSLLRCRLRCTVAPWWCHYPQQAAAPTTACAHIHPLARERAAALRFPQCTASSQTAAAEQAAYTATHTPRVPAPLLAPPANVAWAGWCWGGALGCVRASAKCACAAAALTACVLLNQ